MRDGKYVILTIDDDPDYLEAIRTILEADGYLVEQARSAEEGLRVATRTAPDLVIVDLMMEEIDAGTSFVTDLRALGRNVPIYMLSSVGDQLDRSTSYASLGLAGVFQKPLVAGNLLKVLKEKLKKK
jgi:DNA-binding response OmpR family regulator